MLEYHTIEGIDANKYLKEFMLTKPMVRVNVLFVITATFLR